MNVPAAETAEQLEREKHHLHAALVRVAVRRGVPYARELLSVYGASTVNDLKPIFCASLWRDCAAVVPLGEAVPASVSGKPLLALAPIEFALPVLPLVLAPATKASLDRVANNLPPVLLALNTFVCGSRHVEVRVDGRVKSSKKPIDPKTGGAGRSNKPATWSDFTVARDHALAHGGVFGVGLNLLHNDFVGLDLDNVLCDGVLIPAARDVLARIAPTYCERSPSGTGLRMFYVGRKPAWFSRCVSSDAFGPGTALEAYDGVGGGRYLTVTGDRVDLAALCAGGVE